MVCEVLWRSDPDQTRVDALGTDTSPRATWTYVLKLTHAGETVTVDDGATARIGRDASNEVVVNTDNASRLHARIFSRDGHFVLADQSTMAPSSRSTARSARCACVAARRCSASAAGSASARAREPRRPRRALPARTPHLKLSAQ